MGFLLESWREGTVYLHTIKESIQMNPTTLGPSSVYLHASDVKIWVTYTSKTKKPQHIYASFFLSPQEKTSNVNFKLAVSLIRC